MKFVNNRIFNGQIEFLNQLIGQADVMDPNLIYFSEEFCPYTDMIMRFTNRKQLLKGPQLEYIFNSIEERIKFKRRELKELKSQRGSLDIGEDPHYYKSDDILFRFES